MRKTIAALGVVLAAASVTGCDKIAPVKSKDVVADVWQPGHYPGHDQWYCTRKTDWLLKIKDSASGKERSRCVTADVGQRQVIGEEFKP